MGRLPSMERKAILVIGVLFLAALATPVVPTPLRAAPPTRPFPDPPRKFQLATFSSYEIHNFPVLEALPSQGQSLAQDSTEWMKKWKGMNLEDSSNYQFKELSGSTSINMKIQKIDESDPKGHKSRGSFVPR